MMKMWMKIGCENDVVLLVNNRIGKYLGSFPQGMTPLPKFGVALTIRINTGSVLPVLTI